MRSSDGKIVCRTSRFKKKDRDDRWQRQERPVEVGGNRPTRARCLIATCSWVAIAVTYRHQYAPRVPKCPSGTASGFIWYGIVPFGTGPVHLVLDQVFWYGPRKFGIRIRISRGQLHSTVITVFDENQGDDFFF